MNLFCFLYFLSCLMAMYIRRCGKCVTTQCNGLLPLWCQVHMTTVMVLTLAPPLRCSPISQAVCRIRMPTHSQPAGNQPQLDGGGDVHRSIH